MREEPTYHFIKGQGWVGRFTPLKRLGWFDDDYVLDDYANQKIDDFIAEVPEEQRANYATLLSILTLDMKWDETFIRKLLFNDKYFRQRWRDLRYYFRFYKSECPLICCAESRVSRIRRFWTGDAYFY